MGALTGISKNTLHTHGELQLDINNISEQISIVNVSAIAVYVKPENVVSEGYEWQLEGNSNTDNWVPILDHTDTKTFTVGRTPPIFDVLKYRSVRIRILGSVVADASFHIHLKGVVQRIERLDGETHDAFGRLRVSTPITIFDSKQLHNQQVLFWSQELNGGATSVFEEENASTVLSVAADGDYAIRQTKMRFNYAPGKGQLYFFTGNIAPQEDILKIIGAVDHQFVAPYNITNGLYFSSQDGYMSVNVAKSGTITTVNQADWNIDTMDGLGPSGAYLNADMSQIFTIDYEWLGIGSIRFGFFIDGHLHHVHKFKHANTSLTPYISTPNLPISYEIRSTGGAGSMRHICCSVNSESGLDPNGKLTAVYTENAVVAAVVGVTYAVIGIRLKQRFKDVIVIPLNAEFFITNNASFRWSISINPVILGTFTYTDLPDTESALQVAYGATENTVAALGNLIATGFVSSQNRGAAPVLRNAILPGIDLNGTQDTYVVLITPFSTNSQAYASLQVREL